MRRGVHEVPVDSRSDGKRAQDTVDVDLVLDRGLGVDEDFVYATASGANTFTVKAVDRAGNTSAPSNGVTEIC